MPHSPRWHEGRLWVLESGTGRFADASGDFVITRFIDTVNLTTIGAFAGTISSPGGTP
jgi:hypothetical protein